MHSAKLTVVGNAAKLKKKNYNYPLPIKTASGNFYINNWNKKYLIFLIIFINLFLK